MSRTSGNIVSDPAWKHGDREPGQCYYCWQYTDELILVVTHPGDIYSSKDKYYCKSCLPAAKMMFTEYNIKFRVEDD